jgi:transposase-like protein
MVQRGRKTSLEERIEIGERWESGQTDSQIAIAIGRPLPTVRKWRRKYQREGRSGLVSRMGRPAAGALGQFPLEMRGAVREMREHHSGWGPLTIRTELENDQRFVGIRLPSRSRIAAFLKQEDLTRKYERHSELPQPQAVEPERAHEEWEVDAKGIIKVSDLGSVSIININDLFSRLKVDSFPCLNTSHPNTRDYQLVFRRAFLNRGLPKRVSLDHDNVFYDNASASPYPTTLHLWLIALGVDVCFIKQKPPAAHSVIERAHQTITQQAVVGRVFADGVALQQSLDERLAFLNSRFPSRPLDGQPPLVAHPEARHSGRPYRPEWEKDMLDMQRVYGYLAQGRWFRITSTHGQFSLGTHRYNVGTILGKQTLEITFDPQACELKCLLEDGSREVRFAAQGLTKADLMGELDPLIALPAYQLALPFSRDAWREMTLCNCLTDTTL